ncbi:23S rRNA (pseudouridine(1915)-N(3))-methyltransferase RlmH [Hyphomicrobium sp.]|jgi:23S rRNA (pseudouridine1915-N3)-methyltransferase|uniref:23S rRNA (pseudouridine(1915)-N(3))-methyltransferase RlmH n=1 Tax=Hyphomicrobium sp. TaxID=82 RepID=UPI002BAEADB8|nr:23S rRNA (pseudouridine(1915)-N(3))-methyltransferase RlmH [Hyphomicrobium sp.]HVZ03570.1 23S rRNA (pseudouridine(1915)-N(3))-methyltransferase RlmH [Hyphomicrobium sp.]
MRIAISAIGKLKDAEERAIVERYVKRLNGAGRPLGLGPIDIHEIPESRAPDTGERKRDESVRLIKDIGGGDTVVVLEPTGKLLTSEAFAGFVRDTRDGGCKSCFFLIGGPDGHGEAALGRASLKLSLGALTLPHGLARVVLIEQLYRAATILSGHPYHRA